MNFSILHWRVSVGRWSLIFVFLTFLSSGWRADSKRHQEEIIDAIRSTANEQVPFNVQGYLDEFSKALAIEVRTLLNEVGRIREEKRALQ